MVAADGVIYMVLEYGDIDLARLLAKQESARRTAAGAQPDENFIRLYWQQMLQVRSVGLTRASGSVHASVVTCRRPVPDGHILHGLFGSDTFRRRSWTNLATPGPSIRGDPLRY